jgi:hypothetical protein
MDRNEEVRIAALHVAVQLARARSAANPSFVHHEVGQVIVWAERFEEYIRSRPVIRNVGNVEEGGA